MPPTVNMMYRSSYHCPRYKTGATQEYQTYVKGMLRQEWKGKPPYDGSVSFEIKFLTKDKRKWDIDNRVKALQDCLSMAGVIEDDSQIEDLHVHRERGDRTVTLITLKEYEERTS